MSLRNRVLVDLTEIPSRYMDWKDRMGLVLHFQDDKEDGIAYCVSIVEELSPGLIESRYCRFSSEGFQDAIDHLADQLKRN